MVPGEPATAFLCQTTGDKTLSKTRTLFTYCFHRWYVQVKGAFGKAAGNAGQAQPAHLATGEAPNAISIHRVFSSTGQTHSGTGTSLLEAAQNSTLLFFPSHARFCSCFPSIKAGKSGPSLPQEHEVCTRYARKPRKREEQQSSNRSWHKCLQSLQLLHLLL